MVHPRNALLNSAACTPVDLPAITSDDHPMCTGDSKVLAATPPDGDFAVISGPGYLQGNELISSGEGTIMIQYNACNYSVNQSIESFQTPVPILTLSNDTMCSNTTQIIFSEPPGGDLLLLSGPGSLQGNELRAEARNPK